MKLSSLLPVEDIHEAVKVLGYEDRNPRNLRHQPEAPMHMKLRGHDLEFQPECVQVETFQRPFDTHKKQAGFVILMLIGVRDVGAVSIKEARDSRDESLPVWTADKKSSRICHCSEPA